MTKKVLSILLSFILIIATFALHAGAVENNNSTDDSEANSSIQPRFSYIKETDATCSMLSSGKVQFAASVTCNSNASSCKVSAKLYRRPAYSSNSWEALDIYTKTGTGEATVYDTFTPTSGYEYKIFASFTAYGSDGSAEATSYYSGIAR